MTASMIFRRGLATHDNGITGSRLILYPAVGLSAVAALIHLWAAPGHFAEWWGYGAFFLLAALIQGLYGLALLCWPTQRVFTLGIASNLALISFYVATRTAGIPFFGPHAWEVHPAGMMDLAAVAAELGLVAALVILAGWLSAAGRYLAFGAAQAFGVGIVLHSLHSGMHAEHGLNPAVHFAQGALLSIPPSVLSLLVATALSRRMIGFLGLDGFASRLLLSLTGAVVYALVSIPADGLAAQHAAAGSAGSFVGQALRDASVTLGAALIVLLAILHLSRTSLRGMLSVNLWRPRAAAVLAGGVASLAIVVGPAIMNSFDNAAVAAAPKCSAANYDRSYDVAAINVEVPYNRWGGIDRHGQLFVLQGDKQAVKNWSLPLAANAADDPAGNRRLRPRPLVIRANAGECVKVEFANELNEVGGDGLPNNPRASMKVFGPSYNATNSDGSAVGYNPDTTVPNEDNPATARQENKISYFWKAPSKEGLYLFRDMGAPAGSEADGGSQAHGLYGGFAVEPAGSTWTDPTTGDPIYAGVKNHKRITKESGDPYIDADIIPAGGKAFRESVQLAQDELPGGNGFGFNYGAEPGRNRIATNPAGEGNTEQMAPDSVGEETSLSSWVYGDPSLIKLASGPGPWLPEPDGNGGRSSKEDCGLEKEPGGSCYVSNVTHAYPKDPTKFRYAMAGVKETHVFHMHANQWRAEPEDGAESTTIDSQTFGPGEAFTAKLIGGAGSKPGTVGDAIFHCHLYPHFADGFWGLFRVHDVLEDGTNKTPDGVNVRPLKPLQDRTALPEATPENPGYPRFIPGKFGWRAPQAPGGIFEQRVDDPATLDKDESKDDPTTVEREDLKPADRIVAGRPLDATLDPTDSLERELAQTLAVEKLVQARNYGGATPKPGAPLTDPCPSGSREVTYNVTVLQRDLVYNERGDHDTQGRILVPTEDADDILAGRKEPEPLFFRANAGDCINFNLTNRLPNFIGNDAFVKLAQTNMFGQHIHLVKFDVLGSDGASNGWNYQQAAFTKEQAAFNKNRDANNNVQNCDKQSGCRVPTPNTWDPTTKSGAEPGQTISERWYADYELRTAFTHDHHFPAVDQNRGLFGGLVVQPKGMDFRNPKPQATGPRQKYYQPINDPAHGTPCGSECTGTATGTAMDVIGPGPSDDFREFGLAAQDFVPLTRKGGDPANPADTINPPNAPEDFPDADPGVMAINYKNAPFSLRQEKNGVPVDPAYTFSSSVWGDPATPVLEAYSEDPVKIRAIQGSQEEQHVFSINGIRWKQEPDDPESPLVNSQAIGVSEAFNFETPRIECGPSSQTCAGDYLYSSTAADDLYTGMWGLLRARGKEVNSLLPLPDNVPQAAGTASRTTSALAPPEANSPGTPCPAGAPVKKYSVVAMQAKLTYNEAGDNDPYGLIYALASDEAAIRSGNKKPEPLVLRANQGDCIEVNLTNKLTRSFLKHKGLADGDAEVPSEPLGGTPAGLRVSLHPQLVKYDIRGSDGTAVGYNRDQTVGPGESKLYRWYADKEAGATNLTDFGDVRGHRHHGLFAGLNIEPKGSTYRDPETGKQIQSGIAADIRVPGKNNDFREFTTFFQDGLNLRDKLGNLIEPSEPAPEPGAPPEPEEGLDPEDEGEKGFNYTNAPFVNRLGYDPVSNPAPDGQKLARVFSSRKYGDPDTPIFRTYVGDEVRMRILQGADKPRQNTFQISGHAWKAQPSDPGSSLIATQGGISVGRTFNAHLSSAGGSGAYPGDYMYGTASAGHLSQGLWGIMRVYPQPPSGSALNPTPLKAVDNPFAGRHPIMLLNITAPAKSSLSLSAEPRTVRLGKSTTLSGKLTASGKALAREAVILEQRPTGAKSFSKLGSAHKTSARGSFSFARIKPKKTTDYRVRFAGETKRNIKPSVSSVKRVIVRR